MVAHHMLKVAKQQQVVIIHMLKDLSNSKWLYISHAEGDKQSYYGNSSHVEGNSIASGYASHVEGSGTLASGTYSYMQGY